MVRIITDSAADFEPEEMQRMGITCIPLTVIFGESEYQENINLSKELFYELLTGSGDTPHTSQPSPSTFLEIFREARESGDDAVAITLSSALSGTYQSTCLMRDEAGYDNCYVIDGLNGTGGQRMLVEYAVRLRDEGKSAREIVAAVEALRERVVLFACVDTLEYLHRGGRISDTAYKIGSIARIKPIIQVDQTGHVIVPAKTMGMKKGMDYLCRRLEQLPPDPDFPLYVMYTGNRTNGEVLAKRFEEMGYEIPSQRIINVGAAIGSHVGPDACGMVYIGK